MGVQQVAVNTAFSFPTGAAAAGNIGESREDFAELVRQQEVAAVLFTRDRRRLIERERVAEVGFFQFQREQYEIRKMLLLMRTLVAQAPDDLQEKFFGLADDLEDTPPYHPEEMHARIAAAIACVPLMAPRDLRRRMREAYARLKRERDKPDPERARLRQAEEQQWMQPEALLTAAFL